MGNYQEISHTYHFPDKKLHGTYLFDGNNHNNQGDESRTTALERQVQTLATAVERLTKQNHDLEEQLCQRNAALNTQDEDQDGTSIERRTRRGQKVAMPQADKNNKIPVVRPA